jgi:hypothetical protein
MGGVTLTEEELRDPARLSDGAAKYADEFLRQENSHFDIGPPDWSTDIALVYTIEAARALAGPRHDLAVELLGLATEATKAGKIARAESERI